MQNNEQNMVWTPCYRKIQISSRLLVGKYVVDYNLFSLFFTELPEEIYPNVNGKFLSI